MSQLKLLIVDDEPDIRSHAKEILKGFTLANHYMDEYSSFEIIEAETGVKAIEIIDSMQIDIVLLNYQLPEIEGLEVLEYIKKKEYDISVMMITSYAYLELAIKAINNGAFNFVQKPFTPQELKTSVENITKNLILKRMTRKINEEEKQIRFQFLSVLSHELKSPINAVESYLKIMKDKQAGDILDNYMDMIDRCIERINGMRNLIFDILDLSLIESGKKNRDLKSIDIMEIVRNLAFSIEPLAIQKNIKIHLEGDDTLFIPAAKNEVEIIFNNLISNAVKYNVENGHVYIKLEKKNNVVVFSVQDTGIGMTQEEIRLLFQDFVRIKNSKTKFVTGSGLGLSIAKKITELYGGTVDVESKPDVGSIFTVRIPV